MSWTISRNAHEMDVDIERSEADVVEDACGLLGDEDLNRQRDMSPGVGDMSREKSVTLVRVWSQYPPPPPNCPNSGSRRCPALLASTGARHT